MTMTMLRKRYIGTSIASALLLSIPAAAQQPPLGSVLLGQGAAQPAWTTSPTILGNVTIQPPSGTALSLSPPANTNNVGLSITQSGPTSGSVAGPVNLNLINISSYNAATNAGTNFSDFGAWSSAIVASRVNFTLGGANLGSSVNQSEPFMAFMGHLRLTTATTSAVGGDFEGVTGATYVNASAPNANMEGIVGFAVVDSGATVNSITGVFAEVDIINSGSVTSRRGVTISSLSTSTASGAADAAILVGTSSSAGGFKAYTYLNQAGGGAPIQSTGDFVVSSGAMTINNVFNASNWTVTSNIMSFPNWSVTGAGAATLAVSQTVPQIYGGSGTASALNINSTSNVSPSGDKINLTVNGMVATLQNPSSTVPGVVVNQNATALASSNFASGTGVTLLGAAATQTGFNVQTYAQAAVNILARADGTAAVPTKLLSGETIGSVGAKGFDNSGVFSTLTGIFTFKTAEDWNGTTNRGTSASISLVPAASGTLTLTTTFFSSGGLAIGSSPTDPGAGGLWLGGATVTLNALGSDATHTDRTVCQDTTSKSLFFGSGTAGICLGTSSARFKHDIEPLRVGLAEIVRLQAVSYRLNRDHGDPNQLLYGFTAEQGQAALPALVGDDDSGRPQTFDYMGVVPVLVRAVQQLKADNDNLRGEIEMRRRR